MYGFGSIVSRRRKRDGRRGVDGTLTRASKTSEWKRSGAVRAAFAPVLLFSFVDVGLGPFAVESGSSYRGERGRWRGVRPKRPLDD